MNIKLLAEHHLEFLSLTGGCTGLSESTLVKMPHCLKSHVTAQISKIYILYILVVLYLETPDTSTGLSPDSLTLTPDSPTLTLCSG